MSDIVKGAPLDAASFLPIRRGRPFEASLRAMVRGTSSMFTWTPVTINGGGGSPSVISHDGNYGFSKTLTVAAWDNAVYSDETFTGDVDLSYEVQDIDGGAIAEAGFTEATPTQVSVDDGTDGEVLHGIYTQDGLAFPKAAGTIDTTIYIQGLQVGDVITISRRGGTIIATSEPARVGSPLTISTTAPVNPLKGVLSINQLSSAARIGFGPMVELIADPAFDDALEWSGGSSWVISGGEAAWDATVADPLIPKTYVPLEAGKTYRITYDLVSPDAWIHLAGSDGTNLTGWTELVGEGIHTFEFTPVANHTNIRLVPSAGNGAYTLRSARLSPAL